VVLGTAFFYSSKGESKQEYRIQQKNKTEYRAKRGPMKIYLFPVWTPNYYTKVKNEKEKLERKNNKLCIKLKSQTRTTNNKRSFRKTDVGKIISNNKKEV